jgi:DNA polymerase III, delta subunit
MAFKHKIFLFYGENEGLKKEFKEKIKKSNQELKILRLNQEEIIKNENVLTDEILNNSLFEEKKVIFIEQANDKLLDTIEQIIDKIENEKVFIFSNILDKKSKMRSYFEKSNNVGVSACYSDNEISIRKIIESKLKNYQGLTPQIINLILQNTNLDRSKVNNEIEKIQSCFKNKKIDPDKIESVLNISENEDFNKLRDEALSGNKSSINRLLADTIIEKDNNVYYLNIIKPKN